MEVVRKDGLLLVRELAAEVKNHMDFKINAVMVSRIFYYWIIIKLLNFSEIILYFFTSWSTVYNIYSLKKNVERLMKNVDEEF